ncbi:MAG: TerB family tellurite resistance protein [bacterium]|nr:TerB family tellurite resistance protein [bacterium]
MGLFDLFKSSPPSQEVLANPSIRKIIHELEHMPQDQAKYLAAFAYILGRVAHVDLDISEEETATMEEIVSGFSEITPDLATLIVQIAKSQNILFGATDNYLVVREFKKISDPGQKEGLLHCLFAVAGADDEITSLESDEIRRISKELGLSHREFIDVRTHYLDKLSVLKNKP